MRPKLLKLLKAHRVGPNRRGRRRRAGAAAMNALSPAPAVTVRAADPVAESARIDAFVAGPSRRHALPPPAMEPGGRARLRPARAIIWSPSAAGAIVGCLPLTEVRSPLFGNALVSAGFGTGGGILGDEARRGARRAAWALAALGCRQRRAARRPDPRGLDGAARASMPISPAPCPATPTPCSRRSRAASAPRSARAWPSASKPRPATTAAIATRHFRVYAESVRNLGTPVFPRACSRRRSTNLATMPTSSSSGRTAARSPPCSISISRAICQPYWGGGTARRAAMAGQRPHLLRGDAPRHRARLHPRRFRPLQARHRRPCPQEDLGLRARPRSSTRSAPPTAPGRAQVNPLSPQYRLKVAAWQKLPLWLANRVGPLIARGLG